MVPANWKLSFNYHLTCIPWEISVLSEYAVIGISIYNVMLRQLWGRYLRFQIKFVIIKVGPVSHDMVCCLVCCHLVLHGKTNLPFFVIYFKLPLSCGWWLWLFLICFCCRQRVNMVTIWTYCPEARPGRLPRLILVDWTCYFISQKYDLIIEKRQNQ